MLKDNTKDIHGMMNYQLPITLFGNLIKVGVIGGGTAALLKAKGFIKKGSDVTVLSREFCNEIKCINDKNLSLVTGEYNFGFIKDKHIIIIAINEKNIIDKIIDDCNKLSKIYINSHDFRKGMGVIPVSRESENIIISINSKLGNPKGSIMVADKVIDIASEYDDFINYSAKIRENIKRINENKKELLNFIISEDFKFFYKKGVDREILNLFYDDNLVKNVLSFDSSLLQDNKDR